MSKLSLMERTQLSKTPQLLSDREGTRTQVSLTPVKRRFPYQLPSNLAVPLSSAARPFVRVLWVLLNEFVYFGPPANTAPVVLNPIT